jgi:hypothetical protein
MYELYELTKRIIILQNEIVKQKKHPEKLQKLYLALEQYMYDRQTLLTWNEWSNELVE